MRLITPYAPPSFIKPCLIVSTIYCAEAKETAIAFVHALTVDDALASAFRVPVYWRPVIKQHTSVEDAVAFHVELVRPFCNGGSDEEWNRGWGPYLALYEAYGPKVHDQVTQKDLG